MLNQVKFENFMHDKAKIALCLQNSAMANCKWYKALVPGRFLDFMLLCDAA